MKIAYLRKTCERNQDLAVEEKKKVVVWSWMI